MMSELYTLVNMYYFVSWAAECSARTIKLGGPGGGGGGGHPLFVNNDPSNFIVHASQASAAHVLYYIMVALLSNFVGMMFICFCTQTLQFLHPIEIMAQSFECMILKLILCIICYIDII